MRDTLVRTNLVLTKKLRDEFQKEANKRTAGNMSLLFKVLLASRYDMPKEVEEKFQFILQGAAFRK